jgi:hypothetical protein
MSDLKNYLWNNRSATSEKKRFQHKQLSLSEWPDFGFVGCPKDYIILSAYLVRQPMAYEQLKKIANCSEEVINHFLYVCHMLKFLVVSEVEKANNNAGLFNSLSSNISNKLRAMFFEARQ